MRARYFAVVFALVALAACGNNEIPKTGDAAFVDSAARAGLFEVESSKLALERATSPQLKQFAQMMIDDHNKANAELKELVDAEKPAGVTSIPGEMGSDRQAKIDDLRALRVVSEFEAKYKQLQIEVHQQALSLFENEAATGTSPALKDWAAQTLPKLQDHLGQIRAMEMTAAR